MVELDLRANHQALKLILIELIGDRLRLLHYLTGRSGRHGRELYRFRPSLGAMAGRVAGRMERSSLSPERVAAAREPQRKREIGRAGTPAATPSGLRSEEHTSRPQ